MSTVSIAACDSYHTSAVCQALEDALAPLGGMGAFVSPGDRVLLKVNLLSKAPPSRAVTTHPELVRALIRAVKAAGGTPLVGDSPGGPNTLAQLSAIHAESGMESVCMQEGAELLDFTEGCRRATAPGGELYQSFTLAGAAVDADVLITVPKLKTHGFMMITGAVKNLFGCIPGLEKAQFHLKVPDRDDFGTMLVDLALTCRPALAVMDAVVGMEGDGPAGGRPVHIGGLLASPDSFALDVVASSIAGLDPMEVYTNRAAARRGLGPSSIEDIEIAGTDWRTLAPKDFALPSRDLSSRVPAWLSKRVRHLTTARPYLRDPQQCTSCRMCEQSCPVQAITLPAGNPVFDLRLCIRCYCCQELCPPQVIGLREPSLARLMTRRSQRHPSQASDARGQRPG